MSFSMTTIENGFYDWATSVSGIAAIWRYSNAPRKAKPYLDLNISTLFGVGEDFLTPPDDLGMASLFGNRELVLEINCYGNNALATTQKLYDSLMSPPVLDTLATSGIVFVKRLLQTNNTTLLSDATTYEERAILELKFRYSNQGITDPDEVDVGLIKEVIADGAFTGSVTPEIDRHIDVGPPP